MTAFQFGAAYFLDLVLGDPRWFPHPVRGFGLLIQAAEKVLRWPSAHPLWEKTAGSLLALGLPALVFGVCHYVILWAAGMGPGVQTFLVVLLAYTTLATRSLHQEAAQVIEALEQGRISDARKRLSRIVGRDTENLDRPGILKGVLETMSENLSDGIVAPLFFLLLGGVPLAMAFKAVSTLDSMVGYKNSRYLHFGWASARLDDLLNYLPARITGLLICLLSFFMGLSAKEAWRILRRDGRKPSSPNAGIPEAALAGALQIQLGGPIYYGGIRAEKPFLGDDRTEITLEDYRKTIMILYGVSLVMALLVFIFRLL
jgi:adenosylcobinamide-phosphate synthase